MTYLSQELTPDEIGDLSALEASSAAPMSNTARRPGESLSAWGKRLQAGDAALAARQKRTKTARTRSGGSAGNFNQAHPRGRGGQWIVKEGGSPGQTSAEVTAVQKKVGAKADGKFGSLTTAAVKAFQRKRGLQVDGVVGAQTVAAMMGKRRAAQVKAGAMSAADRRWLLGHK